MVSQKPKYCKIFERNSHWKKWSMIMVWQRYCFTLLQNQNSFLFSLFIFSFISPLIFRSPFGLKFSQMILHTETSKLMYNWYFLFVVLYKPTLLPSIPLILYCKNIYICILNLYSRIMQKSNNLVPVDHGMSFAAMPSCLPPATPHTNTFFSLFSLLSKWKHKERKRWSWVESIIVYSIVKIFFFQFLF